MKNIFILDTNKESYLYSMGDGKLYISDLFEKGSSAWKNKFIYITNKEDIKRNDYIYNLTLNIVVKAKKEGYSGEDAWYKVVLTNDISLIEDGVQAVDNLFLSFFGENQPDYVEVIKGFADGTTYGYNFLDYKLKIPQEKTKEDFADQYIGKQDKLYNKKDLEIAFNQGCAYTIGSHELFKQTHLNFEDWFNNYNK